MSATGQPRARPRLPPSPPDVTDEVRRRVLCGIARAGLTRCSSTSSGLDWLPLGRHPVRVSRRTIRTVISLACLKPRRALVLPHTASSTSNWLRRYDPLPQDETESRHASTPPRATGRCRSRTIADNTDKNPASGAAQVTDGNGSTSQPEPGCAAVIVQQCSPEIAAQLASSRCTLPLVARRSDLRRYSHS